MVAIAVVAACSSGADDGRSSGAVSVEPSEETSTSASDTVVTDDEPTLPSSNDTGGSTPTVTHADVVTRSGDGDVRPEGFSTVTARVTAADGEVCDVCLWLADTSEERSRGLMGVTDLGDAVGMAFVWEEPTSGSFYMLGTPTPLSIAWFADDGTHVGEADMEPCLTDDSSTCERFGADAPYTVAIETFDGQLGAVGIGPGSSVEIVAGSESPTCLT